MNPQPKPDLERFRREIGWFRPWLITVAVVFFIILIACHPSIPRNSSADWAAFVFFALLYSAVIAAVFVGLFAFTRWICSRRNFERFLFACACLATLIALFCAEEDWRGKHAWENFKRQWEAKGENFDRDSLLPQAVPDDENSAMSPVWVAALKYYDRKVGETWYGDRIYSEEVSNYLRLLPMSASAVAGTNWGAHLPETPDTFGSWAAARMSDLRPWQSFYRNLEETNPSADIAIAPKPQTPAQDVLLALSKYDPLIDRLRQDSQMPYSRFPIGYLTDENPEMILLPHLSVVKQFTQVLELRAIAELQNGQSDKALADVQLMLRLVDANRTEPFLISHLVRLACLQIALEPIYEGLANHQWSDSQLVEMDSKLSNFDFVNDFKFAMRGEMIVLQNGFIDYLRHHPGQVFNMSPDAMMSSPPVIARVAGSLIPAAWYYQNELHDDRAMEELYLPNLDTNREILSPSAFRAADTAAQAETRHANPYNILERMLLPTFSAATVNVAYGQNSVNLARVAIALERYRMAHGTYPDSLDPLAPQYIDRIPHDVINGQPLLYRRNANGQFVLYSVGWNETDDGGVVIFKKGSTTAVDHKQGDWVWRYPTH